MHDLHIGDFYNDTARILIAMYKRFPVKAPLYIEDLIGPDTPDEFGLHSPRHMACFSAALWLAEENYFRYTDTIHQTALDQSVLSQNAFLFFTARDRDHSCTRIARIRALLSQKYSEQLSDYLSQQMQEFADSARRA